ncbi:MAG: hypothetical protein J07HQW2_01811 [Haloquadratum walsbyi J07HQW2]|uniref:Uncharacterized protein n=1 Tax=Haloquadratum walsbyi J07HQW2 TaxID=1238425 RepID=U1PSM4_9EURY|nr:MAG: hypothetical protein J07HQW2_01811 [Haloquadratum walsbyi J07HQW2]
MYVDTANRCIIVLQILYFSTVTHTRSDDQMSAMRQPPSEKGRLFDVVQYMILYFLLGLIQRSSILIGKYSYQGSSIDILILRLSSVVLLTPISQTLRVPMGVFNILGTVQQKLHLMNRCLGLNIMRVSGMRIQLMHIPHKQQLIRFKNTICCCSS